MIMRLLLAIMLLCGATPAQAGPLAPLIPVVLGLIVKSAILKIVLAIVLSVAVSVLSKTSQKKAVPPGIQTERKLYGGTVSRTIMLGLYATAGSEVCPPMSYGNVGKTPNAYLNVVVALADVPIDSLRRLIINGEYVDFSTTQTEMGFPLGGKYSGKGWVKFYDGRQTAADPYLASKYTNYVRPWDGSKVGKGVSYAILTWLFDPELFKSEPEVKFEVWGMRLYDPRKDDTAGGVGSHRFDNPATWEMTFNNIVMVYNILRGITMADGSKYGGECTAVDLPIANWSAAMNVCDETVTTSNGNEPRYRAGFEIAIADVEPATAIEELLKGCSGEIVEAGGIYKTRCGPPSLPVMFITDGDFLVSQLSDYDPFPGIADAKNTVYASYPSPDENWSTHDAPVQTNPAYLQRDQGIEMPVSLTLPAVPFPLQVQRLMLGWLKDDQRWRQHSAAFGHYGFILEPLDCIAWTSARNQYDNKLFEVASCVENLKTLRNTVTLREVDPDDYNYQVSDELPDAVTPGSWSLPPAQVVPGFTVQASAVVDANGVQRRPALLVSWDADAADDADFIKIQIRILNKTDTLDITAPIVEGSRLLSEGILPSTTYQARGKFIASRPTEWTEWFSATTGDIRLTDADLNIDLTADLSAVLAAIDQLEAQSDQLQIDADKAAADIIKLGGDVSSVQTIVSSQGAKILENSTAVTNVLGSVATLTQTVSTLNTTVSTTAQAVDGLTIQYGSLSTLVSTQGSSISQNSNAISQVGTNLATLTTKVTATSPNLLKNASFENGFAFWTMDSAVWDYSPEISSSGTYAVTNASDGGLHYLFQDALVGPNEYYTFSADMFFDGGNGYFYLTFQFIDASGQNLGEIGQALKAYYTPWAKVLDDRVRLTIKSPPTAASVRCIISCNGVTTPGAKAVRQVKLETNPVMSAFTQEATIQTTYKAINTVNSQYANLSTIVSTQGVAVTSNTTAISLVNGNISTLFARTSVTLDVNGYITGWEQNNNGSYGNFVINADRFEIRKPGGGARTEYSGGNWRAYDQNGTLRLRWGVV